MNTISITYELIYRLKDNHNIQFTKDFKKVFNYQKGIERKYSFNGCKGLKLDSKTFIKFVDLNRKVELIPKYKPLVGNWLSEF